MGYIFTLPHLIDVAVLVVLLMSQVWTRETEAVRRTMGRVICKMDTP